MCDSQWRREQVSEYQQACSCVRKGKTIPWQLRESKTAHTTNQEGTFQHPLSFLLPSFPIRVIGYTIFKPNSNFWLSQLGLFVLPENKTKSNSTLHKLYSEEIFWPKNIVSLPQLVCDKSLNYTFVMSAFLYGFSISRWKMLKESFSSTKWLPLIQILVYMCVCFCALWINISFTK